MKYIIIRLILIGFALFSIHVAYAQIEIGQPVFTEDFGKVPSNWKSLGKDYQDESNMYSYRGELKSDKCTRLEYEFAKRSYKIIWTLYRNCSMYDLYSGNGKYCLGSNGEILGGDGALIKTWHVKIDHTNPDQDNGLAFIANAKTSKHSFVFENVVKNSSLEVGKVYQYKVFIGNAENGTGSVPNVDVELESGSFKEHRVTGDIGASKNAVPWIEHVVFIEAGAPELKYAFYSVNDGSTGNVFVIDDISLSPVSMRADVVNVNCCSEPGKVHFEAMIPGIPENLKIHTRLMRKLKTGGNWEWDNAVGISDSLKIYTTEENYQKYDFRLVAGLTTGSLTNLPSEAMPLNEYGTASVTENFVPVYTADAWSNFEISTDFCTQPDFVFFQTVPDAFSPGLEVYFRLMRRQKTEGIDWEWGGEVSADHKVGDVALNYLKYDYQVMAEIASPNLMQNAITPKELLERGSLGCYVVKDAFHPDFCLQLFGVTLDYTTAQDSVSVIPSLIASPLDKPVYLRWMYRPFGSDVWEWMGEARSATQNKIDWLTFSTGYFRAVYAVSPELLNAMPCEHIEEKGPFYVATKEDAIKGVALAIEVSKSFKGGAAVMEAEAASSMMPEARVAVKGGWVAREKGSETWSWLPAQSGFMQKIGVVNYTQHEYCFVASMAQSVLDTLALGGLRGGEKNYRLSELITGETFQLGNITRDYCVEPGKVNWNVEFQNQGIPEDMPVIGRWMQRKKEIGAWMWMTENFPDKITLPVLSMEDFLMNDYQLVLCWSHDSLAAWEAGALPADPDYYLSEEKFIDLPICLSVDTIRIVSRRRDELVMVPEVIAGLEGLPVYGRWMKKVKDGDNWEWVNPEALDADYSLAVTTEDFGKYDYRFYAGLATGVFADAGTMSGVLPYVKMKEAVGATVYRPDVLTPQVSCVAKRDSNRVTVVIENHERIKSFVYKIGGNEAVKMAATPHSEVCLTIDKDSTFHLLSYELEGVCDSIIREDEYRLAYIPKLHISGFMDAFGCGNTVGVVKPVVTGGENVKYEWYRADDLLPDGGDTLSVAFGEPGVVALRLAVSGEQLCPEDSTVYLITGQYPKINYEGQLAPKELCVGQPFTIGYNHVEADQYRVILKETNMPGFISYPGSGEVRVAENGELEVRSLQTPLTATDPMVGYEFTFQVQIFKVVDYRGVSYRCEDQFEYCFRVRPTINSRYPSDMKLCMGESVDLAPELELNGNQVSRYRWRLWDGVNMTGQEMKSSAADHTFASVVNQDWGNKRLQLTALCECGEVVVQDISLMVFIADSNRIAGPGRMVLAGEKVNLEGTDIELKNIVYQWEKSRGGGQWSLMPGETARSIAFYAPDTTTAYRRMVAGEGWNCPGMETSPVVLNVFNNKTANVIYIDDKDSLIYSGTKMTIRSGSPEHEGVAYCWERYEMGVWTEIAGESRMELTCEPEDISKFRRVAVVGSEKLYSNEVIVNVYSRELNKIMTMAGLLSPGENIKVIGNYLDIPGVRYRWFAHSGEGWKPVQGQEGSHMEIPVTTLTRFVRYVYLPSQAGDSLCSNEVSAYVFSNDADNRISSDNLNVCGGEVIPVSGVHIAGEGISYRWEYSSDNGNNWIVVNGETKPEYAFTADHNIILRRRVIYAGAPEYYSNKLIFNVIYNSADNLIMQEGIVMAGEPVTVAGSEVTNASYYWEKSDGGESWTVLEGNTGRDLVLGAEDTRYGYFVRRQLQFAQGTGCNGISNVLKLKVFDQEKSNVISGAGGYICEWTEFTMTGSDMADLNAQYQWYTNKGNVWELVSQATGKDLTIYEGCGLPVMYRRDATAGEIWNESNVVEVKLWNTVRINNVLEQPGVACAGQNVVIRGSDALAGNSDLSRYVKSYSWEASMTGAGNSWAMVDSLHTRELALDHVDVSCWYRRIIHTYCGTDLRSEPVFLEVKEKLKLTLRNNAPFSGLSPKEPITISVDEGYYDRYEIKIDDQTQSASDQKYLFYGWAPKKDYQVVVNVATSQGCAQTDTMRMRTPDVDLPNILTPNEDDFNDILLKNYDLRVYNRWGNLLYNGRDGWDGRYKGKYVAAGTYFYIVQITHANGIASEYKRSVTVKLN